MLQTLRLQNFRSYTDESFEFEDGVNIIVGPNASGKTNLLEAIMVLSLGGSFRAKDSELIKHNSPWARLDGSTSETTRVCKIIPQPGGSAQKEFLLDDKKIRRLALPQTLPTVLFEPNHLYLLHGSPDLRRDYIDSLLEQTTTGFSKLRNDYRRALTQRNALLKSGSRSSEHLFAWNIRLSEIGGRIAAHRQDLITSIAGEIPELYKELSRGKKEIKVFYASSCDTTQYSSSLLHKLEANTDKDYARGFTGYGPHRDDMNIEIEGRSLQQAASRGETRTLLLALKILELRILEQVRGKKPLLLLDDVFSELDGARRRALTEVLSGYQTFITTTDADVVLKHFSEQANIIPTNNN